MHPQTFAPTDLAWSAALLVLGLTLAVPPPPVGAQEPLACPGAANAGVEAGWEAYRSDDLSVAAEAFQTAVSLCPGHAGARVGLGYVALREGGVAEALSMFQGVLQEQPSNLDALVGLGLGAWRLGDMEGVLAAFGQVEELEPGNETARDYLARLPPGLGPPPPRPPLVLPDSLVLPARTHGEWFQVPEAGGWRDFWILGMNLGAALPGRNPSEFPDKEVYLEWLDGMARMNVNTLRVYTIHPPHFYEALAEHNRGRPDTPIRLVHGVWTELPPDDDFLGEEFEGEFFQEMLRVVDVIHGRADIRPRPGHASGFYTADVSRWTLAYILGREWEPHSVVAFDSIQALRSPGTTGYAGRFVEVEGGNAMDHWLARAVDSIVAYETDRYRTQRPVSWTTWPTLDPLDHPTETTREEEVALRVGVGERVDVAPREYNNDEIGVDPSLMRPTARFPAGTFASYHAYPYYPDFLILSDRYQIDGQPDDESHFRNYLRELKEHHRGLPVVIAEYGVPASHGPAHLQPQGWHHGGHTEAGMAEVNRRLTLELVETGMAGGMVFAWIDEWFKKNWLAIEFELPPERNRLWYNRMDAEQHYGMIAMEAEPPVAGTTLQERLEGWREIPPLHRGSGLTLRAAHDAAYLWILVEGADPARGDLTMVGLDMVDPGAGEFRWPGARGGELPVGIEFALVDDGEEVRILAHPPANPFRLVPVGAEGGFPSADMPVFQDPPPGFFQERLEQRTNVPYTSLPLRDGVYDSLRVIPNRRRISRDGREFAALGYDRGVLRQGPAPDGLFERGDSVLEVRIPWLLLNVTDPSSRAVLSSPGGPFPEIPRTPEGRIPFPVDGPVPSDTLRDQVGFVQVEDIGILAAVARGDGSWTEGWSAGGPSPRFSWPRWEEPSWRSRERPTFSVLGSTFQALDQWMRTRPVVPVEIVHGAQEADTLLHAAHGFWEAGEPERAEPLYRAVLALDPTNTRALHRVALAAAWDDRIDEGLALLERLLELEPGNVDARLDQARFRAWKGDHAGALLLLDALAVQHPSHPRVLEERARVQAWAGEFDASLASWDALLAIAPGDGGVRRDRARTLSWAADFQGAVALWDSLLVEDPGDGEARLGRARALAYANRLGEALEEYGVLLSADPGNLEARRERGRTLAWAGRLVEAEEALRALEDDAPEDVDARVALAQVLRWQGRTGAALAVIRGAARLAPGRGDVEEQRRWLEASSSPSLRSSMALERDSDRNRMATLGTAVGVPLGPSLSLQGEFYHRWLRQPGLDRTARGGQLGLRLLLEPGWVLTTAAGVAGSDVPGSSRRTLVGLSLTSPARHPLRVTTGWSRSALDATAGLAQGGLMVDGPELSLEWTPPGGWALTGGGSWTTFQGVETNTRRSATFALSRRLGSGWRAGLSARSFAFSRQLAEGYFSPTRFQLLEGTGSWTRDSGRWSLVMEGAAGVQRIGETSSDPTLRGSSRASFRPGPGREFFLGAGASSAGIQSFASGEGYRYTALLAGGSWTF
jgi:tetratricopeptide (TPR) repeat protein